MWAWGANGSGQLGDGTLTERLVPADTSVDDYAFRVASPVPGTAPNTFTTPPSITLSSVTSGATIRYTVDGTTPDEASALYVSAITPAVTMTLRSRAYKAGRPESLVTTGLYTLQVATPTASPNGGTFTTPQSVALSTATGGATVRYTTDGSTPTETSAVYTAPIAVATPATLKAVAFKDGWQPSAVRSVTFNFNYGTLPTPTSSLAPGTHVGAQTVTLAGTEGAELRYTTTGSEPTTASPLYAAPLPIQTSGTLKVKAFKPGYTASATLTVAYTIKVPAPTLSQPGGTYAPGTTTVVTGDVGTTMRMTLSGADPGATDVVVASGAALTLGQYTLKVRAFQTGCEPSDVTTATYGLTDDLTQPKLAAGQDHSVLVLPDGTVQAWGRNASGQLGLGHTTSVALPAVTPLTGVIAAAAGVSHTVLLMHDATVLAVGNNGVGQLGDGTTTQRTAAIAVAGLTQVTAVAAGNSHSLALRADGTVWAWGSNSSGQLGDGSTTTRTSPVPVPTLTDVVAIAAGASHSLAVKSDGTVWAWGLNTNRQLADPSVSSRTTPGQVPGLTTAQDVAAGSIHSLARLQDGTLVAWGGNGSGQLGDGTTTQRAAPVAVLAVSGATSVHAGDSFSAARDGDGQVWTWGANGQGQLATGAIVNQSTPAAVAGLSGITRLGLGQEHALALSSD